MENTVRILMLPEAIEFLRALEEPAKKQFSKYINRVREGHRGEWSKKMESTDEIWEFRVIFKKSCFRLFAFWDSTSKPDTLIVCTHGFQKKSNKTPPKEIDKAEKLKKNYFE